jgi:hypothetical protein
MKLNEYVVAPIIPIPVLTDTLQLAGLAAASLYGDTQVLQDAPYRFDPIHRRLTFVTGSDVAEDFERLVLGMTRRAFGNHALQPLGTGIFEATEYRTLMEWAEELGMDTTEVKQLLLTNLDVHLDTRLTSEQMHDLIGLTLLSQRSTRE